MSQNHETLVFIDVVSLKQENASNPESLHRHMPKAASRVRSGDMTTHAKQRKNLAKMGGRVATVQEFLGLSDAEVRLLDLTIHLVDELRERGAYPRRPAVDAAPRYSVPASGR